MLYSVPKYLRDQKCTKKRPKKDPFLPEKDTKKRP